MGPEMSQVLLSGMGVLLSMGWYEREWSESGQGYVEYDRSEHSYHLK
jgi:hypothetical protein